MAKSPPSFPFYPNDYYRDTRLLQPTSRGIWMDILCKLHESGKRGDVTLPLSSWLQWCGCPQDVFLEALRDIAVTEVGVVAFGHRDMSHVVTLDHFDVTQLVTVKNRRMVRERNARESDRLRQQKHRASQTCHGASHAAVTTTKPASSFPSSSSPSHWEPPNPLSKGVVTAYEEADSDRIRKAGGLSRISGALMDILGKHLEPSEQPAGQEGS